MQTTEKDLWLALTTEIKQRLISLSLQQLKEKKLDNASIQAWNEV